MSNSGPSSGYSALPPPAHSLRSYTPSALALPPVMHFLRFHFLQSYTPSALALPPVMHFLQSCTSSGSTSSGSTSSGPGHHSGLNIS